MLQLHTFHYALHAAGTLLNNYAHIFDLLIRLRQVGCVSYVLLHSHLSNIAATKECLLQQQCLGTSMKANSPCIGWPETVAQSCIFRSCKKS